MANLDQIVKPGKRKTKASTQDPQREAMTEATLDELCRCKAEAKDYAKAFGDAIKAQADKHGIKPSALRRYVSAREADKAADLRDETNDLADLLG